MLDFKTNDTFVKEFHAWLDGILEAHKKLPSSKMVNEIVTTVDHNRYFMDDCLAKAVAQLRNAYTKPERPAMFFTLDPLPDEKFQLHRRHFNVVINDPFTTKVVEKPLTEFFE
jgi:hypothetical protein